MLSGGAAGPPKYASLLDAFEARCESNRPWLHFHQAEAHTSFLGTDALLRAQQWGRGFVNAGVRPGERVGIWHPNSPDFVASFFGALGAGAVPVPVPWPVLEGATAAALAQVRGLLQRADIHCLAAPRHAHSEGYAWAAPSTGGASWSHRPRSHDTAFLQFTSGSTGSPRGAVISHGAALHNASALVAGLELAADDVGVSWVPFFHDMGLIGVMLTSLVGNFPVHVLRPSEFLIRPWRWLELVGEIRASLTVSPDFGYALASRRCGERTFELGSLRCALSGSEPLHFSTLDTFGARFSKNGFEPGAWISAYGLAENTLGVTVGSPWGYPFRDARGRHLPAVGAPLPGIEVALHGPESEVCVRSPSLAQGYWGDVEQTAKVFVDGWLHTGDLGLIEGGQLCITGRKKDLVIKAGTKFHPGDIEHVVAECLDAPPNTVAAFNDGDQLVLVVEQRQPGLSSDVARVRAVVVDRLGVRLDRVDWVPMGTLPKTTSGKVRRGACAEQFGARP
jgi:acyl-CoA synthetase (AMP-forming)/AMP-acid ligase II